ERVALHLRAPGLAIDVEQPADLAPALRIDDAADAHPFVGERGDRHPPALVDLAHALRIRDAGVGEVHLVEVRGAAHRAQGTYLDTRGVHVDDERGDALVLGHVRVGARYQQAVAR